MDKIQEDPFDVTIPGTTSYTYSVYPEWDDVKKDSFFVIGIDAEDIGTLHLNVDLDKWEWIQGGLDQNAADEIGKAIDSHYN